MESGGLGGGRFLPQALVFPGLSNPAWLGASQRPDSGSSVLIFSPPSFWWAWERKNGFALSRTPTFLHSLLAFSSLGLASTQFCPDALSCLVLCPCEPPPLQHHLDPFRPGKACRGGGFSACFAPMVAPWIVACTLARAVHECECCLFTLEGMW